MRQPVKRLDQMLPQEWGVVVSFEGGRGLVRRLEAMGLRRGAAVKMVACQPIGGPVVIEVAGTRLALGRGVATRIIVSVCPASGERP